jgi:hypothetical protein
MNEQYNSKGELTRDTVGAKVKHFTPEKGEWDRFGNFLFVSNDLAYLDGLGDKVKAGILISPEGGKFIKQNPGIINEIDNALSILETKEGKNVPYKSVNLSSGGNLQAITTGGQSNFYILTMKNAERYAIKTHAPTRKSKLAEDLIIEFNLHQPYINEMLQTQALATDLKNELDSLHVKMSSFLFASGQVSCTRYEEDEKPYLSKLFDLNRKFLKELKSIALTYIEKRSKDNSLWDFIYVDLETDSAEGLDKSASNFRTKADGTLVWVDPFKFSLPIM